MCCPKLSPYSFEVFVIIVQKVSRFLEQSSSSNPLMEYEINVKCLLKLTKSTDLLYISMNLGDNGTSSIENLTPAKLSCLAMYKPRSYKGNRDFNVMSLSDT